MKLKSIEELENILFENALLPNFWAIMQIEKPEFVEGQTLEILYREEPDGVTPADHITKAKREFNSITIEWNTFKGHKVTFELQKQKDHLMLTKVKLGGDHSTVFYPKIKKIFGDLVSEEE